MTNSTTMSAIPRQTKKPGKIIWLPALRRVDGSRTISGPKSAYAEVEPRDETEEKMSLEATVSTRVSDQTEGLHLENAALRREIEALRRQVSDLNTYMTLAYRDPLTGLRNRRAFEERMTEEIARATRHTDRTFSLVVIDVNHFKHINDTHGHVTGDEVLKWVGSFIDSNIRGEDVCCRLGGDEFAIILPDTDVTGVEQFIARLRVELTAVQSTLDLQISLSIGAATYPAQGKTAHELMSQADAAMYLDKRQNRPATSKIIKAKSLTNRRPRIRLIRSTGATASLNATKNPRLFDNP